MALFANYKTVTFGVGDKIRVTQKIQEGDPADGGAGKTRSAVFEGLVIAIKGKEENKTFTVRRIGEQKIGIERIFPLALPSLEKVEVLKKGTAGVRRAKLYYVRRKSIKEIDKIYARG